MKHHPNQYKPINNLKQVSSILAIVLVLITIITTDNLQARLLDPNEPKEHLPKLPTTDKHPFLLIDHQLTEHKIDLIAITKGKLQFTDQLGRTVSRSLDDLLLLLRINNTRIPEQTASSVLQNNTLTLNENPNIKSSPPQQNTKPNNNTWSGPVVELIDGKSFTGQINSVMDDGATIIWRNDIIGKISISMDDITRLYLRPTSLQSNEKNNENQISSKSETSIPAGEEEDTLELVNGDRMVGFISFQDSKNLTIETDNENTTFPLSRISSITLANEQISPPANACRIVLDDGSIFDIDQTKISTRGEGIRLAPVALSQLKNTNPQSRTDKQHSAGYWADFNSVRAISFRAGSIKPLTTLTVETNPQKETQQDSGTRWFDSIIPPVVNNNNKQPLSLNDILYEGPAQFQYPIPEHATRFAARASIPRSALDWADFNLIILADNHELYREHFNANKPADEIIITLPLQSKTLTIRIQENNRGPIQNIITLHHPLFLLNPTSN